MLRKTIFPAIFLVLGYGFWISPSFKEISAGVGGLTGPLSASDRFGFGVDGLGDVDGDGVPDIAVSAFGDAGGGAKSRGSTGSGS